MLHLTTGGAGVNDNRMRYLGQHSQATEGAGVVDHVAFRADGLREMLDHLTGEGIAFTTRQVSAHGLFQIFLFDPNGVKIELNFENAEADGIPPELLATSLES